MEMMSHVHEIYIHIHTYTYMYMYVCEGGGLLEERTRCEVVKGAVSILNSGGIASPGDIYRLANYSCTSRVLITCTHHVYMVITTNPCMRN